MTIETLTDVATLEIRRLKATVEGKPILKGIDLTVERITEGEVSTYLHDVLVVGDQVEVRGPIGGYFV